MNEVAAVADRRRFLTSGALALGVGAAGLIGGDAVAAAAAVAAAGPDDLAALQTALAPASAG